MTTRQRCPDSRITWPGPRSGYWSTALPDMTSGRSRTPSAWWSTALRSLAAARLLLDHRPVPAAADQVEAAAGQPSARTAEDDRHLDPWPVPPDSVKAGRRG